MPDDSNGNYSLPNGYLAVTGQKVLPSNHNPPLEDIGTALTARYSRDGRAPMLGNVPMGGFLITNMGDGASDGDAVNKGQLDTKAGLETVNTFTKTQKWSKGADVASAAALTLGDDGNYFDVTGTTAITSIATVGVGTVIKLHFDGALTLTHHATDLVLTGAANITTAAGDEAEFVEYAAGGWRCTNYVRAAGLENRLSVQNSGGVTLSGTSFEVTGIPAGAQRVFVDFEVDASSGSSWRFELGSAGGFPSTGYSGVVSSIGASAVSSSAIGSSFIEVGSISTMPYPGLLTLTKQSGNIWKITGLLQYSNGPGGQVVVGKCADLSGELSRLRFSTGSAATLTGNAKIWWEF